MSKSQVEFIDKFLGSLHGAMIGDALGWVFEDRGMNTGEKNSIQKFFVAWKRRAGGRYQPHEEEITAGSYSDDTQLIFATARSLQYKNWYSHFVKAELPSWLLYERGGGGATKRAANAWSNGIPPWKLEGQNHEDVKRYFNAGGNGVVMRIMPHVFLNMKSIEDLSSQIFLNGIATHGHPRALLSAIVYGWALHYLIQKKDLLEYGELINFLHENKERWSLLPKVNNIKDWQDASDFITKGQYLNVWNSTVNEIVQGLDICEKAIRRGLRDSSLETLEKLNCFDRKTRGAGTVATLVSIYMASKYATDPASAIMDLASMSNADTDTNASLTAALFGAIHGTEWIHPEWYLVQDYDYAKNLIKRLGENKLEEFNERLWSASDNKRIKEQIEKMDRSDQLSLGPFSWIQVVEKHKNKSYSNKLYVNTYKCITSEGQTLYIKISKKNEINSFLIANSNDPNEKQKYNKKDEMIVSLSGKDFKLLNEIVPQRVTVNKVFTILSDLLLDPNYRININENETNDLVRRYSSGSLDEKVVRELIFFIKNKITTETNLSNDC